MSMKSENLTRQDALWRAYVNADPDLHRLEQTKKDLAYKHIRERRERQAAKIAIFRNLLYWAVNIIACAFGALGFYLFILMAHALLG